VATQAAGEERIETNEDDTAVTRDKGDTSLKYRIVLMIKHPNMDPARVSMELGMQPTNSWRAGEERATPTGQRLPGVNPMSFWTSSEEAMGDGLFFEDVLDLVRRLGRSSEFISQIVDDGGSVSVVVQLPGGINIGDELDWLGLTRIAALKITLGIEVFPDFI
jgi:hypothetical protein